MEARNTNFVFKQNRKDNWNEILTMGNKSKKRPLIAIILCLNVNTDAFVVNA